MTEILDGKYVDARFMVNFKVFEYSWVAKVMRSYTMYTCEKCSYESSSYADIMEHEAKHYNCTSEEYKEYLALKQKAAFCGCRVSRENNEGTRKAFDEACEKLTAFEKAHNIKE